MFQENGEHKDNKAAFLDRDGPIIIDKNYLSDPEGVALAEGAAEGIALLRQHGYKIIIISGQSGVGRGYFTRGQADAVHERVLEKLKEQGVDDAYYCYHAPNDECVCRKPNPSQVLDAAKKHNVDLGKSFMAGDKPSDLQTGRNAHPGMKTVLIGQKEGDPLPPEKENLADHKSATLLEAARWIIEQEQE